MTVELLISDSSGKKAFIPAALEGIEWSTQRRGTPGKLTFNILNDNIINFEEGAAVRLKVDGKPVFFGFVFTEKQSRDGIISVTAYDQLRYLSNKDTYVYKNKTASQFIKMLADDFRLNVGTLDDTSYIIASRVEDNTSLFDMIENAVDITTQNTGQTFVLYDDFGKLTLKNIASMKVGEGNRFLMLDEETGENFDYSSSIDENTYNKIKLIYENEEKSDDKNKDGGKRDVYIAQDGANMNAWGVLQYCEKIQKGENGKAKADALLKLYNSKTRKLQITDAFGDTRVRAGSMIVVNLNLSGINVKNFMLVEKAVHKFECDRHLMTLTLRGGEFVG